MAKALDKLFDTAAVEREVAAVWKQERSFHAEPDGPSRTGRPYVILIPPPNVTAILHVGHALNNTLQDILVRWRRMAGDNAVWLPGTDHAGISTQTVVEKRLLEQGKRRTDFSREEFIAQVQAWKDEYERRITDQLVAMGCSCDFERQAFTMDEPRSRSVREAFFRLFRDGLIYRGKRLVNWDPVTQTALADDEVEDEEVDGFFYYLRYPLVSKDGAAEGFVTVATTRPETMLGDTAVAVSPRDARAAALRGRQAKLPIVDRIVPVIEDDYVVLADPQSADPKARYATGFLKVTPAHDLNDWEIGQRHGLAVINIFAPDASISDKHGWADVSVEARKLVGMSREKARAAVVEWFKARGLLEEVKPYRHSVGHSYRSHAAIEPYLSDQWYCKVTDDRLRGAALRAMAYEQRAEPAPTAEEGPQTGDAELRFSPARYARTYQSWHENLRDWCISRQLWWGHRIGVWSRAGGRPDVPDADRMLSPRAQEAAKRAAAAPAIDDKLFTRDLMAAEMGQLHEIARGEGVATPAKMSKPDLIFAILRRRIRALLDSPTHAALAVQEEGGNVHVCVRDPQGVRHVVEVLEAAGFRQDPDVLDTWFSSGLWPLSTLGWPSETAELARWNPSSTLCTAREIITLWVSRMVMFNRYLHGRLPFRDVVIHTVIQDGLGRKMSKSLGNGVDPLDIIATHGCDAMRFTLASTATQTQDVRLPVERDPKTGKNTSPKFDEGRSFANKIWNIARFVCGAVEAAGTAAFEDSAELVDRWMLSRLARTIESANSALREYRFDHYAKACYDFVERDFSDWYVEAAKPALRGGGAGAARKANLLATALDVSLRLLHPVTPFVTERLWWTLNEIRPTRGIPTKVECPASPRLISAAFAEFSDGTARLVDPAAEEDFAQLQRLVSALRNLRKERGAPQLSASIRTHDADAIVAPNREIIESLAGCKLEAVGSNVAAAGTRVTLGNCEIFVAADAAAEQAQGQRTARRREELAALIAMLQKRLANPGYADRAPGNLVQQTRDQLAAAEAELKKL